MELFRGYVPTRNKQCLEKFKGVEKLKTRSEVQDLDEYAGILGEETILIDVDDAETSELLFRIVQDLELKCRVYATTRGKHFLFKNCGVKKSWTKCTLAVGITTDGKVGANNSYEILKSGGVERPILYDFPEGEIQELPKWLTPVKSNYDFPNLGEGDGRNQTLFNYINISPSATYNEKWYFKKVEFDWNPVTNKVDTLPTQYGFYRLYNYNFNVSASTTVYGMYDFTKKRKDRKIQAIRHTLTPSIGFSYTPDFGDPKYGYYQTRQTDSTGRFTTYSPYSVNAYGVPSSGRSMSMNFSLSQNLEMKVLSKRDTSGVKKIKLIDELRISGSYNFLADSMRLSTIPISFRTTLFQNFGINLSMTLDPYRLTPDGKRYNKLFFPGRIVSTGWSFGYTFKSRDDRSQSAINDITSIPPEYMNPYYDPYGNMDPVLRRQYMSQMYYDFSLPWNFGFNYAINYNISTGNYPPKGYKKNVTQTVSFNGSLTITPKTGITFQGGYDIKANKLTTSSISISRDLHCWQMSFSWIPFGFHRSWSFNIGVKAASLSDLKYDKSQSMYDNMY